MKKLVFILSFITLSFSGFSQIDLGTFLEGGADDANTLLQSYMEPAFVGFGYGFNSGWYNTAKPHKLFGFDITASVNLAYIPNGAQFFTFNDANYSNVRLSNPANNQLPTFFGPNLVADDIPELTFLDPDNGEEVLRITGPTGLGIDETPLPNAVPSGMVQLGIGLPKNTELKLRFVPKQSIGDPGQEFEFNVFGIGLMHDFKQWIPGMKLLPFDLSAFFGYTNINTAFAISSNNPDQKGELNINGLTFQAVASKTLAVFTVYAGVGYISSSTDFALKGTYTIEANSAPLVDPVAFEFSSSGARANIGAKVKLLILTLHGEYAIQKYNTLTLGVGISVR